MNITEVPITCLVDRKDKLDEGCWEGSSALRIDPNGRIDRVVPMPAKRSTNVCFGGARLDTLNVTTARVHVDADHLHRHLLQGGLFCFNPGVAGFEKHTSAG